MYASPAKTHFFSRCGWNVEKQFGLPMTTLSPYTIHCAKALYSLYQCCNWLIFAVSFHCHGTRANPAWRFGTCCLIRCVIWPSSLNVLGGTSKRISLPDIRDMIALEVSVFHGIALYKSTSAYLLTRYYHVHNARFHGNTAHFCSRYCSNSRD